MEFGLRCGSRLAPGFALRKRARSHSALALVGVVGSAFACPPEVRAADVNITTNVSTGINLDTFAGSTADVAPGVSVSNTAASAVSATVNPWTLTNRGSVSSTLSDTVSLSVTGSSVINFSSITGDSGSNGINLVNGGSVDNRAGATISAGLSAIVIGNFGGPGTGSVTNAGTITQTAGFADTVELLSGGTVTNLQGGTISGQNGSNAVSVGQGSSRTVINYGTIINTGTGFATGVLVQGGASTVTNYQTGLISGTFNGVFSSFDGPLTLTNNGVIKSTGTNASARAVEADAGGTITNTGTIQSAASDGLFLGDASTVTNSGTISGATLAINFSNSATNTLILGTGSVLNGSVQGGSGVNNLVLTGTGSENISKFLGFQTLSLQGNAWTLTGSGTFSTSAAIQSGVLYVDGQLTSPLVTVAAGATLGGIGTVVGTTTVASGGTLAPGSAGGSIFGPLTVQGSLSFSAASTYMIQVSPANAGRTNVTGTATLGGATVNAVFTPGSYINRQYTIVNATGGLGGTTFNPAVISNLASLQPTLSYDANNAFLNIKVLFQTPNGPLTVNQQNVANALTNFFNTTGGIPFAFAALSPAGLSMASGELPTAAQQTTFDAMNLFMGLLTDPFMGRGGGNPAAPSGRASAYAEEDGTSAYAANGQIRSKNEREAYAMFTKAPLAQTWDPRWSVWAAGFGGSQSTDGNAVLGSNTATSRVYGTAVGADYRVSANTLAGFALAGGGTSFSIANALGSGRSDVFQAGAFVRHTSGPAYVSAALAYGWQDITTDRNVTLAGMDRLHAQFNANAFSGRLEGGYRFVSPWMGWGITPYAAAQFTTFGLPAYAEQVLSGANTFALNYGARDVTDPRSELGVRTDRSFAMQNAILTLRGRFAWAHDFDPDRNIAATFQTLPGASFVVNGAAQAHDSALTTVSAEMKWRNGWSAAATFEGEFSNVASSYAGKGVVRYTW